MTTQADLFTEIKRRLWNLVGAVEITEPEAEELCRLIRTRARLAEAALAIDQRWCGPRDEG